MAEEDAKRRWGGLQIVYEEIVKDDLQQSVNAERTEVKIVTAPHVPQDCRKKGYFVRILQELDGELRRLQLSVQNIKT